MTCAGEIDAALVQALIAAQFPQWADLPIRPVANDGHDNRTFHLGDQLGVRLPSAERYAAHVALEHEWLPELAPQLPLPIPQPLAQGKPAPDYPWPWTVNHWLPGEDATTGRIDDLDAFAIDLARFLNALYSVDATRAPAPGRHNFYRGGLLAVYDAETRECIGAGVCGRLCCNCARTGRAIRSRRHGPSACLAISSPTSSSDYSANPASGRYW